MRARPTGLTKDAGWQIGVSRTLPHPPSAVWEFVSGPEGLALWLGPGAELTPERGAPYRTADGVEGEVRGYRPGDRIRVTYGPTTVQVAVSPAGDGTRAVLRLHQERMASREERERQRAHWRDVAARIAAALDGRADPGASARP
ncbi:SRPBCC domain-containing protein [Streptomyces albiaxialis]|uniref:SRPBCC domain-containing protein n=1 Tax=Streptomyces albiaxialis TaxID=329523 RepID=A0ABN2VVJ5_9ACTN